MLSFIKSCWKQDASRRLLWIPVLFAFGISIYFSLSSEPSKWLTLAIIESLIILAAVFRHYPRILYVFGILAIILAGFTVVQIKSIWLSEEKQDFSEDAIYIRGKISSIDTNFQGRPRFIMENVSDFNDKHIKGKIRITQRAKNFNVDVGDCVEMAAVISPLSSEVVVGGYQFDRKGYFEGLKASGYAESRWFKIDCATGDKKTFSNYIANFRREIVRHIHKTLPVDEAGIASAIIAGERGGIGKQLYEQYRNSGLAHFLSISGLHMSMLAGIMFFLIRFILAFVPPISLRLDTKKIAAIFAIILSFIYLLISGQAIPAQRAFIMTFVVLLGVLINRRAISMATISLAAFIVLFISPEVLVSASFQMSFAAVMGLIAFYEKISSKISKFIEVNGINKFFRIIVLYISGVVISDLIASIMTLPFAIYHFNMVAIYTTIGNFLAGPIIGLVIMPFVLMSLLFMPFGADSIFLKIVGAGISWVNEITSWVSSLPNAGYQVASMPHWGLMLIVFGGLWLMLWLSKWRYFGIIAIFAGILSMFTVKTPDILISPEAKVVAFKNSSGELEIVSSRGGRFIKDVWKNKYKFSSSKTKLSEHPELRIDGKNIEYFGQKYNLEKEIGLSIYNTKDKPVVKTIRQDIGYRNWNSN